MAQSAVPPARMSVIASDAAGDASAGLRHDKRGRDRRGGSEEPAGHHVRRGNGRAQPVAVARLSSSLTLRDLPPVSPSTPPRRTDGHPASRPGTSLDAGRPDPADVRGPRRRRRARDRVDARRLPPLGRRGARPGSRSASERSAFRAVPPVRHPRAEGCDRLGRLGGGWDRPGGDQVIRSGARHADLLVIADVCFCEYTDHGHCGVLRATARSTTTRRSRCSAAPRVAYAGAGADIVAPSDMMDGQVGGDPRARSTAPGTPARAILPTPPSSLSAFYGPFREAAESAPEFGDRAATRWTRQRARGAARGGARRGRGRRHGDGQAGAAVPRHRAGGARARPTLPLAAYNVSGEYAMSRPPPRTAGSTSAGASWKPDRHPPRRAPT